MLQQKDRIEPRHKVCLRARLHGSGFDRDACVLDASTRGLLLTLAQAPRHGEIIEIFINGHRLFGQVEWSNGRRMGMKFHERIDVLALIGGETGTLALKRETYQHKHRTPAMVLDFNQMLARKAQFVAVAAAIVAGVAFMGSIASNSVHSLSDITALLARR